VLPTTCAGRARLAHFVDSLLPPPSSIPPSLPSSTQEWLIAQCVDDGPRTPPPRWHPRGRRGLTQTQRIFPHPQILNNSSVEPVQVQVPVPESKGSLQLSPVGTSTLHNRKKKPAVRYLSLPYSYRANLEKIPLSVMDTTTVASTVCCIRGIYKMMMMMMMMHGEALVSSKVTMTLIFPSW
jgi:hypothetical protein